MSAVIGVVLAVLAIWILIKVVGLIFKIIAVIILIGLIVAAWLWIRKRIDRR
jgi:O-antigen/teichoic acid export membrane protein